MNELTRINPEDETSAQVRQQLERTRARLATSVDALRDDMQHSVSKITQGVKVGKGMAAWVRQHPMSLVVAGLAVGLWLGSRRDS